MTTAVPKPRKYRFSIDDPDAFLSTEIKKATDKSQGPAGGLKGVGALSAPGALAGGIKGRQRGSVFMLEGAAPVSGSGSPGKDGDGDYLRFRDDDIELLSTGVNSASVSRQNSKVSALGSRSVSKEGSGIMGTSAMATVDEGVSTFDTSGLRDQDTMDRRASGIVLEQEESGPPEGLVLPWEGSAEDIARFPTYITDLNTDINMLSVVISSRHESLRKKRAEKPELFEPGTFGMRILGSFSDALQVGTYVMAKAKYMLATQVIGASRSADGTTADVRRPVRPTLNKDLDKDEQVDEAMRSMHACAGKMAILAEDVRAMVHPKEKKRRPSGNQSGSGNVHTGSGLTVPGLEGLSEDAKPTNQRIPDSAFIVKLKEFEQNGWERRKRISSKGADVNSEPKVNKEDFFRAMDQFLALRAHFAACLAKAATLQRMIDTGVVKPSVGGAVKVLIAASRFKKNLLKNKK